jgi:hypothetical protein
MGAGGTSGDGPGRIAFVSRRGPGDAWSAPGPGSPSGSLPELREGRTLLLLTLTVLLQAFAWSQLHGYQLADSVEFMDRAYAVARGETLDSTGAVRGFGFSTFLLPFFALAQKIELENMRLVVHAVRLLQMLFGLGLVFFCTRLGAHLGGRRVGYVAGFLVAVNPIFLQYSVDPVSGVAAAFFVALSLDILIVRCGFARSLVGGLALGAAFMMAYQTILIGAPLVILVLLRGRSRHTRTWLGALSGLTLALLAQFALDKLTYGTWGISIRSYLIENSGGVLFTLFVFLGLEDAQWVRDAYQGYLETLSGSAVIEEGGERRGLQSVFFYLHELPTMLVYPVLLIGVLGLWRAWRQMNWKSSLLLVLLLLNVLAMSLKGSKSFRLWLPLLPMLAPLCAWGWGALVQADSPTPSAAWRRLAGAGLLLASLVLGVRALNEINPRRYGAYWDAIDYISARAHEDRQRLEGRGEDFERQTVGSAYNWAVFCRSSADARVVKFSGHLDQWHALGPPERASVVTQMAAMDWLVVHGTVLRLSPDLTAAINQRFEVIASFWDEDTDPTIRDVRVLRNLTVGREPQPPEAARRTRRLFEVIEGIDPTAYRQYWQLDYELAHPALFVGQGPDGREERLQLLGFDYEELPTTGFGWITYHWYTDTAFERDYVLVDRVTTLECPWGWQNNHVPGHGALPTSTWKVGWIVRESYLLVPGHEPFQKIFKPLGGAYRRGDLLPAMLWIHVGSPPPDITSHMLLPADWNTGALLDIEAGRQWNGPGLLTAQGYVVSPDRLMRVAKFLMPVNERYRWPDDGGPGPDDAELNPAPRQAELEQPRAGDGSKDGSGAPDGSGPGTGR